MKLGVWLYLLMVIMGVVSYYCSEPLMRLMPQDKDGNIGWQYSSVPVLLNIGGLGLAFFGFIYAKLACETELKKLGRGARFSSAFSHIVFHIVSVTLLILKRTHQFSTPFLR